VTTLSNIVKVSAGIEHSMAINKNHELFSWGSYSQTGLNDSINRNTPAKMDYFRDKNIKI